MTDAAQVPQPSVLARVSGRVGHLTLNRPRAINALDVGMLEQLRAALDSWRDDSAVQVVLLDGAGERGLCAGGDIRKLYDQIAGSEPAEAAGFFRPEYALDAAIGEYSKPVITLADGITMGGGIGLAGHAAIRVVTERSKLAMPETRIGFTPDVGGTRLLARAPGRLGEYLGLTGSAMDAADALYCGFADFVVASDRLDSLRYALQDAIDPAEVVRAHAAAEGASGAAESAPGVAEGASGAGPSRLAAARPWIDDAFAADTVPAIVERLRARPEPEASIAADTLDELSPIGLAVTLESVRRARTLPDLRAVLAQEYGLVMWFVTTQPDLAEGIRAQVVDKDRSPSWNPSGFDGVSPGAVASAFSFIPPVPLWG